MYYYNTEQEKDRFDTGMCYQYHKFTKVYPKSWAALVGSSKLAIHLKILEPMMRVRNSSFFRKKNSNRFNLINKCIIICSGLVYPSVRVLVKMRLLREFGCSRGRCRGVFGGGTLIKQLEQVKCIHDALSLRVHAEI